MRCMIHDMVKCKDCGHSISPSARNCPQCGGLTEAAIRADSQMDPAMKWILILGVGPILALFFAVLGQAIEHFWFLATFHGCIEKVC